MSNCNIYQSPRSTEKAQSLLGEMHLYWAMAHICSLHQYLTEISEADVRFRTTSSQKVFFGRDVLEVSQTTSCLEIPQEDSEYVAYNCIHVYDLHIVKIYIVNYIIYIVKLLHIVKTYSKDIHMVYVYVSYTYGTVTHMGQRHRWSQDNLHEASLCSLSPMRSHTELTFHP